jgi:putative transposase
MTKQPNPARKHPAHLPNQARHNKPVLLFVTVCALDRAVNTFATEEMHGILKEAWANARSHQIGAYVLMPDHIHLFCVPAAIDSENVAKWVRYWKVLVTKKLGGSRACATQGAEACAAPGEGHASACLGRADARPSEGNVGGSRACATVAQRPAPLPERAQKSIFQRDCWDTQLRAGDSYHEKWEYVRNNPVRKGLATSADKWPYWGIINELVW